MNPARANSNTSLSRLHVKDWLEGHTRLQRVGAGEAHALGCQFVDIGSLVELRTVAKVRRTGAKVSPTEVVCDDVDNVWLSGSTQRKTSGHSNR